MNRFSWNSHKLFVFLYRNMKKSLFAWRLEGSDFLREKNWTYAWMPCCSTLLWDTKSKISLWSVPFLLVQCLWRQILPVNQKSANNICISHFFRVGHPFFSKECSILCVLFCSFKKNEHSFSVLFVFISRTNIANLGKKNVKRTFRSF